MRLRAVDWRLVLPAAALTLVFRLAGALLPHHLLARRFAQGEPSAQALPPDDTVKVAAIGRAVAQVGRRLGGNCVIQAMTASVLLRAHGFGHELEVGVRKSNGRLAAHAWVRCANQVVVGDGDDFASYTRLARESS
jgi:hypothetical protein